MTCDNLKSTRRKAISWELISAAKNYTLLQCLLPRINIEAKTKSGYTLLILASAHGNIDAVKDLVMQRAYVYGRNKFGLNAFILAAEKGSLAIVKYLLKEEPGILDVADNKQRTALIWASIQGHTDVVKFLIDQGADVNVETSNGETALLLASKNDHDEVVSLLLGGSGIGQGTSNCKWSEWSSCSKTCGTGQKTRFIETSAKNGGQQCLGANTLQCNLRDCSSEY